MQTAQLSSIPEQRVTSPQGKYRLVRQSISQALGGKKDAGTWGGGHPFDVEQVRLEPGAANFPFHAHSAQWEMYVFLAGSGEARGPDGTVGVAAGDSVLFRPGEAHQLRNTGAEELVYLVIADQHPADVVVYPDTPGKWAIKPQGKIFTITEVEYYEPGE